MKLLNMTLSQCLFSGELNLEDEEEKGKEGKQKEIMYSGFLRSLL
jgi:hypothetical protein